MRWMALVKIGHDREAQRVVCWQVLEDSGDSAVVMSLRLFVKHT